MTVTCALHTSVSSSVAERYTHDAFFMCFISVTFIVLLFNYDQHNYVQIHYCYMDESQQVFQLVAILVAMQWTNEDVFNSGSDIL